MKEHKFKVGDLVRVIGWVPATGQIGKITMVDDSELPYRIEFEHRDLQYAWYNDGNLELIKRAVETKHRPGDRFVIEVDSVLNGEDGKPLYKIKGFNALVFDDNGLDRLEQAEDKDVIDIREHYNVIRAELADAEKRASLAADDIRDVKRVLDYIKDGKKA